MKRFFIYLCLFLLCLLLCGCTGVKRSSPLGETPVGRTPAVIDVVATERSKIEIPETTAITTLPQYFEVVATAATTQASKKPPEKQEPAEELFTVKFVDIDGYTALSVQSVAAGASASEPPMPKTRGDLIFRGWDKDFSNISEGMVVKAIYQKEWLTVRFFDADATLLKETRVRYGDTATAPEVSNRGEFLFNGWNADLSNITKDLNVYATYRVRDEKKSLTLADAFSMFEISENTIKLPSAAYYRKEYTERVNVGKNEYHGNIIYGNFCDMIPIGDYGFSSVEGILTLYDDTKAVANEYELKLYIYLDGKEAYTATVSRLGASKNFSVDISGAKEVTIRLETLVNGSLHYGDAPFVGGLVNTSFVE